jgi:hypothetical protein
MTILDAIETLEHCYLLERSLDKLSRGLVIFKICPHLGEFHQIL